MTTKKPKTLEAPLELLVESPLNTRKTFDAKGLEDLAASIAAEGVLQTLLCRPRGKDAYEVLAGSRRMRAARMAAVESVPIRVRFDLDDDGDALEAIITENNQREDLPPLEEADGFAALIARGRDVATVAAKLGRSESYVRHRLRLVELVPAARALLGRELLTLGAAMLIAQLDAEAQTELLEELGENYAWGSIEDILAGKEVASWVGGPTIAGTKDVRDSLRSHHRELGRAPWLLADATLSPTAGACTICPKRTGAQVELFGDVGAKDACLDKACWDDKVERLWEVRRREAVENGARVIEGDEAKKIAPYGHLTYGSSLVDLDEPVPFHHEERPSDEGGVDDNGDDDDKVTTWRAALGRHLSTLPRTLIRAADGTAIAAIDRAAAAAAIASALPKTARQLAARGDDGGSDNSWAKQQKAAAEKAKRAQEVRRRAVADLVQRIATQRTDPLIDEDLVRLLLAVLVPHVWSDGINWIRKRRELEGSNGAEAVLQAVKDLEGQDLDALFVEVVLCRDMVSSTHSTFDPLAAKTPQRAVFDHFGVDIAKHQREVAAEGKAKKKPAKKASAKRSTAKASS